MPTLEQNIQSWNRAYDWSREGEEWSDAWGGSEAQWFGAILPRIHSFLPTGTLLEIGPGFGRWTNYLRRHADKLVLVDLSQACIDACRERFAGDSRISCHVNDGKSLAMVPDHSIDFVFSFDSLVHAEADVLRSYVMQIAAKLRPTGIGFVHHSNLGEYRWLHSVSQRLPSGLSRLLEEACLLDPTHWRASSMTAALFRKYCEDARLTCIAQEIVHWGTKRSLIDCFSVFVPRGSDAARATRIIRNRGFMREAQSIRLRSTIYQSEPRHVLEAPSGRRAC